MARASDYQFISEGLDSIAQARVRRLLQDYQVQRDAEEKRRYDEQMARQLSADKAVADWRTQQGQRQTDLLAFQKQQAADTKAFREGQLTRGAQAQADAQAQNQAFSNLLLGGEAAPQETSQFEHLNPTGEAQPLTGEGVAKAAAGAGILTPDMARNLADTALRERALTAKGGEIVKDTTPQPFKVELENGVKVFGIRNPVTGNYETFDGDKKIVAEPLFNKDGSEREGWFVVDGKVHQARQPKPASLKEINDELARLDEWEASNPAPARVGKAALGQQAAQNVELRQSLNQVKAQLLGVSPGGPATPPASPAPAAPVKVISPDGRTGTIQRAQLEAAQKQGYKLAP